jgi:hypothetical protein
VARVVLPESGPPVVVPTILGVVLLLDLLVAAALVAVGVASAVGGWWPSHPWLGPAVAAYGVALVLADLFAARMSPSGLGWRRRLVFVAIVAVVWRNGPLSGAVAAVVAVLYSGVVWVALVVGGRALSRAIATATGEDKPE